MYSRLIRVERPLSPSRRTLARKELLEPGTTSGDIELTENIIEKRAGMLLTKMFETYKGKASALESVTTVPVVEKIAQVVIKKFITGVANKMSLLKEKEAEMFVWKIIEMHKSIAQNFMMVVVHFILFTILINCYRFDSSKKRVPTSGAKEPTDDEKSPFSELGIPFAPNVADEGGEYELKKRKRKVPKPGTTPKVPDKRKRLKVAKLDEGCYFSDLTEEQLIPSFSEVRKFRFVPCKVYLSYNTDDAKASTRKVSWQTPKPKFHTYDLPKDTAHCKVGSRHHQLFGTIQAAGVSLDPASPSFNLFNHKYNDPILVPELGSLSPHFISYCSVPFSTSVKIAAKLYVTTDKVDAMKDSCDYYDCYRGKDPTEQFNDAFEVCNDCAVINFSESFAKKPNGVSGSYTLKGRDGHLKLYYVALKYAVDAALEVVFDAASEETKVAGRVMAYYGKNFDYGCSPAEKDDYKAMLFETEQNEVKPGKINLMRSVLSVPAQFSLVIDAHLTDSTSGAIILSGVYEFLVPTDGSIRDGCIKGNDCSLKLKVDWKLPPFAEETTPTKRPYYSELIKKQVFAERSIYAPVSMDEEDYRWSLQEKISQAFSYFLHGLLHCEKGAVSVSISTGMKADDCDYLCTSVLNIWPELRSEPFFEGPKSAGLYFSDRIPYFPQARMLERCFVGGPGFLKFKISGKWIAKSIYKMLMYYGIDIWAPRLPMKKTIINFSRNIAKEMCMDHLRCTILGETLAHTLKYSGVCVHKRFHDWDHMDIKSKKMMTEFLIDRFPNEEVNDQAILELEVLYEESKKRFEEDAEFRNRTQQGWDKRHKNAWVQICKISRERYQEVYLRLGIHVEEEDKSLHDSISQTKSLLEKQGFTIESEGDEAIFFEGRKLHLVDLASLWHALEKEKADRIVHVADVGQRDKIEMCITAVKSAGLIVTNHAHDPLSHVGFHLVKGKDFEGFRTSSKVVNLVNLLEEAKSRCQAVLVRQGTTLKDKELEHTAEALGYGAVKYANLKNNRLTNYTFSFTDMFNENMFKEKGNTAAYLQYTYARICKIKGASMKHMEKLEVETLTLKDGKERELGLHLLRFTEVLEKVCRVLAPHIMCEYLYVLCKKFDKLYSPGWQVESGEDSKLLLCEATKVVMRKCFYLLGITPIYKL